MSQDSHRSCCFTESCVFLQFRSSSLHKSIPCMTWNTRATFLPFLVTKLQPSVDAPATSADCIPLSDQVWSQQNLSDIANLALWFSLNPVRVCMPCALLENLRWLNPKVIARKIVSQLVCPACDRFGKFWSRRYLHFHFHLSSAFHIAPNKLGACFPGALKMPANSQPWR